MDLEKVQKQWEEYQDEFNTMEIMDIETHTGMALQVGGLLKEIQRLESALDAKYPSSSLCWRCGKRAKALGRIECEVCHNKQITGG